MRSTLTLQLSHGAPGDTYRHVGDLGNIKAGQDGVAIIDMEDKLLSLTGINNILARGVVIHAGMDDMGKVSLRCVWDWAENHIFLLMKISARDS